MASEATRCTAGNSLMGIVATSAGRALAAPIVYVAELRQSLIGRPPIGDDRGARLDVIHHEFVQGLSRRVGSGEIRHRPSPLGSRTSTAIPVRTFLPLTRPPASPGSAPPM